jgi:predicted P-loop ATPase
MGRKSITTPISDITVSYWEDMKKVNQVGSITIGEVVEIIQSDKLRTIINRVRSRRAQDEKNDVRSHKGVLQYNLSKPVKEKLPSIISSGIFTSRSKKGLQEYKGIMAIDYDHIPKKEIESLRTELNENKYVYTVFTSPSGEGLKVLIRTNAKPETHRDTYLQWGKEFPNKYWDKNVHDYSRLMFLSWDPLITTNSDCEVYKHVPQEKPKSDSKKKTKRNQSGVRRSKSFENRDLTSVLECVIPKLPATYADERISWVAGINALISEFGANARELAHLFSSASSKYSRKETDKQFDYELNKFEDNGAKIGTFVYWASTNQIPFYSEEEQMFRDGKTVKQVAEDLEITEDEARVIKEGIKEKVKTPVVAIEYIKENYDFRTNVVTGMIESASSREVIDPPRIYTDLMKSGYDLSPGQIQTICRSSEIAEKFDPINEYLQSLKEVKVDGFSKTNRLADAVVLEDESQKEWFTYMLQKMLVRTVACGLGGTPNRTVFILTDGNRQYIGKSTWIRYIGGIDAARRSVHGLSRYYLEEELKNDKDMDIAVCENFIWNVEEYESLSPKELSKFKMTVSKANSKVRRPYAAFSENLNRRCSFFASTNHDEMLSDGNNSRYIVFRVKDVLRNYQDGKDKVNMDDVWAEAYAKFQENPNWGELSREELLEQGKMNDSHKIGDPLEDYIMNSAHENGDWIDIPAAIFNRAIKNVGASRSTQHSTKVISEFPDVVKKKRTMNGRFISLKTTIGRIGRVYEDARAADQNPYLADDDGNAYMSNK